MLSTGASTKGKESGTSLPASALELGFPPDTSLLFNDDDFTTVK